MSRSMRSAASSVKRKNSVTLLAVVQLLSDAPFMVSFSDMETLLAAGQASAKVKVPVRSSILCPSMMESSFPTGTYTERNKGLIVNCGEMEEVLSAVTRGVPRRKVTWWCRRLSKGQVVANDFGITNSRGEKLVAIVPLKTQPKKSGCPGSGYRVCGCKLVFHALGDLPTQNSRLGLQQKLQEDGFRSPSGIVSLLDYEFTVDYRINGTENLPCSGLSIIAPVLDYAIRCMKKPPDLRRAIRLGTGALESYVPDAQIWPLEMLEQRVNRQFDYDEAKTNEQLLMRHLRTAKRYECLSRCPKLRDHISLAGWDAESHSADALNMHRFASACLRWVVPNSELQNAIIEALNDGWDSPEKAPGLLNDIIFGEQGTSC
ncbi:hypothetical protein GNI_063870 [Gregarina niphandrodes]|uniref:Uncharacterized protein n=1 Tax=Gregarina niphandrodes TaxID=110365 RepID=A0A023B7Z6_GRENI|nr:hypothetical protein GNI_063870 [Gregarina niphandrodes]EZG68167.1 hypothetical protein GNI_063870 [Gregarina niphandrodes]|eukprot:XP_011130061.1 hypothetical protein GNI_063870 [Gregarina niphandrodes]